jgi:hypothetical protein
MQVTRLIASSKSRLSYCTEVLAQEPELISSSVFLTSRIPTQFSTNNSKPKSQSRSSKTIEDHSAKSADRVLTSFPLLCCNPLISTVKHKPCCQRGSPIRPGSGLFEALSNTNVAVTPSRISRRNIQTVSITPIPIQTSSFLPGLPNLPYSNTSLFRQVSHELQAHPFGDLRLF